jgi:hypothetical protein
MSPVFPPVPRSSTRLVDAVIEHLHGAVSLPWEPLSSAGLNRPWVGVREPGFDTGRPWVWDVVVPADHEREPLLHRDPMAIPVAQDVVVVELRRIDIDLTFRVPITVEDAPEQIAVAASAVPPPPWQLSIATGWSAERIAAALAAWGRTHVGRAVPPNPGVEPRDEHSERYDLGDGIAVSAAAFDRLLSLAPADAAVVTTAVTAVRDALR